jgi:hypothetical protein
MKKILLSAFLVLGFLSAKAQLATKADISVFPNPATEFIQVNDQSGTAAKVDVYNLVGKKVRTFEFAYGQQYFVSDLPKGMYLIQVTDRTGDIITTQKVTKR